MMGSIKEVRSASTWRLDRRRQRSAMVSQSPMADDRLAVARGTAAGTVVSDTGGLLLGLGSGGGVAGQSEEHVGERGAVHGEPLHRAAQRVDLVEQRPRVGGAAIGRDADGQADRVAVDRALAEGAGDVLEGRGVGEGEVQALVRDLLLELGRGAI